jgi:phosphoserine phosphatase RsbU/P
MKLRWKFFFILLFFSLIPLGLLALVSRQGLGRMGALLAADVRQILSPLASGVLKLTAEDYATILEVGQRSFELALAGLTHEAEAVIAEEPPAKVKVYFASDFSDPYTAPPDAGSQPGYLRQSAAGGRENDWVSFKHPVFLLAPDYSASDPGEDIDRLSLLTESLSEIHSKLGPALHWAYVSMESGVHMSFPGHGGFPEGFDPRQRFWYLEAADEIRWTLPYVDATSGLAVMTVSKKMRFADGVPAGVVGMDIRISEVLRRDALSSLWADAVKSFLVLPAANPPAQSADLLIVAQRDPHSRTSTWESVLASERLTGDDPQKMSQLVNEISSKRSGYVDMPYQGIPSIWAFAPIHAKASFILIVPREVVDRLPEKILDVVRTFASEGVWIMGFTALGAILLAILAALWGSWRFTQPMVELVEASSRLSRGDFNVQVSSRTGDERDRVIQAFNDMVPKLEDHLRMHDSLQLANEVQRNLLPQSEPLAPGLDVAGTSIYCDETGGDYYDFLNMSPPARGIAAVVVADVSGHGVQAALLMASARAALRLRAALPGNLSSIVSDVNRQFTEDVGDSGAFMTLFYISVDGLRKTARWVRAGHDPAFYYDPETSRFEELTGRGAPLGMERTMLYEEQRRAALKSGGMIFIGTDGIWETSDPKGEMFGKQRLREVLRTHRFESAREIIQAVARALEAHRQGLKPVDDITMVVVKIL